MSLNGRWPELLRSCAGSHQVGVYETLIDGYQKLYQRLPQQNLHLQHCLRSHSWKGHWQRGFLFAGCHNYTLFLPRLIPTRSYQSRAKPLESCSARKGPELKARRGRETGNLSCHFLRKGWICCALSVAVAICSKPVCHHDFKMYEMVRASKNWCQIRADQLTDFVSDKTSYPENQLYLSVFVWLCTKPRYVDFQAQPQLTKISENPKLKQHLATVASPVLEAGFSSVFGVEDTREGNGYSVWHGSVGHVSWTFFLISGFIKGEVQDAEKSWMHLKPSNHDLYTTSWCHWCWGGMIRSLRRRDVSPGWVGKGTQWRILSARVEKKLQGFFWFIAVLDDRFQGKGFRSIPGEVLWK